jgi:phosphoribosylformylglycinamidine synthase
MEHNNTGMFESRFLALEITDTDNRFFTWMEGRTLPVWVAHGEGKYADGITWSNVRVPVRYVDNSSHATELYPYNPNGSLWWVAWVLSSDGNVLGMMPHPERTILPHQMAYIPQWTDPQTLSWLAMFENVRKSL